MNTMTVPADAPVRREPASLCAAGPHFVIAPAGEPGANLHSALTALPAIGEVLVLLAAAPDAAPVLHAWLDDLARIAVERGASTLVLAASGLATLVGGNRAAERVAAAAGLPVIAPDGVVSVDPDGILRVGGGDTASWWHCAPHGIPQSLGPIWPPAPTDAGRPPGPAVTTIPAGCWVTADGHAPDAAEIASVPEGMFLLAAGSPDRPDLTTAELTDVLRRIGPLDARTLTFAAPWSPPAELARMAAGLSDLLGGDVRAAVGLPTRGSCVLLDAAGRPTWEPWLLELTASWTRRRVLPSAWRTGRSDDTTTEGPRLAVIQTLAGWELEAIPAGLWLRPSEGPATGGPRLRAPDQSRPLLIVGSEDQPVPETIWEELMTVLTGLRHSAEARLGMLAAFPPDPASEAVARFVARMHRLEWLGFEAPPVPAPPVPVRPALAPTVLAPSLLAPPVSAGVPAPTPATFATTRADVNVPATGSDPVGSLPETTVPADPIDTDAHTSAAVRPAPAVQSVPIPCRPATAEDRSALRALVGARFQRYAGRVDQVVARLPGLRASLNDDVRTDLIAVLLHHLDAGEPLSRADLAAAARRGGTGSPAAFLSCLGSGLRRLPSHRGPVLLAAHAEEDDLAAYVPGQALTEPAATSGLPAIDIDLAAPVELAVWSSTGRRTVLFGGPGAEPEVVFPPGTRFSVIEVLEGAPARVLLRETTGDDDPAGVRDRQAGERLLAWLEKRDTFPPDRMRHLDRPERFHLTPGIK
ncbi:MAG: hypothetical protein ACRDP6_06850 [Actinoallomurus sp.]